MDEALIRSYLEAGFSLIPIKANSKSPLVKWQQYQTERASYEQVCAWYAKWPDMSLAVVTGTISGIVVIDQDTKDSSDWPSTWQTSTVSTRRGFHWYFKHPGKPVANAVKINGFDVRGDGGYVLLPPSTGYEWICLVEELQPLPLVFAQPSKPYERVVKNEAAEGERNVDMASYVGALLHGTPELVWQDLLDQVFRKNLSQPDPLPEDEIKTIFDSVAGREKAKREKLAPLEVQDAHELTSQDIPRREWLIRGLIPAKGVVVLYGKPKKGKSILSTQIALHVATGRDIWAGATYGVESMKAIVKDADDDPNEVKGTVLILALEERKDEVIRRLRRQFANSLPKNKLWVVTPDRPIRPGEFMTLIETFKREHPDLVLVVIDPLVYMQFDIKEQNPYMREYAVIQQFKWLRDQYGISFLIDHHARKAAADEVTDANLGTSATPGAADVNILLRRENQDEYAELEVESRITSGLKIGMKFNKTELRWEYEGPVKGARHKNVTSKVMEFYQEHGPFTTVQYAVWRGVKERQSLYEIREAGFVKRNDGHGVYSPWIPAEP